MIQLYVVLHGRVLDMCARCQICVGVKNGGYCSVSESDNPKPEMISIKLSLEPSPVEHLTGLNLA